MKISVLGSGSTGNAVLLVANGTRVLVDAGMSAREIVRRMAMLGEDANSLDGILLTHEHGDHCGGLRVLIRDLDCPVFISAKTRDAYVCESRRVGIANDEPRKRSDSLRDRTVEIDSGHDFQIGKIDFHPFTVPHDAVDNFGFTATHDGVKVATLLDFGHVTTLITERLRGCAAIVIESNHSRDMLKTVEHVAAVIRFDHNRRTPAQPFRNQRRYVTKIEQRRDLHSVVRRGETKIVDRIVR